MGIADRSIAVGLHPYLVSAWSDAKSFCFGARWATGYNTKHKDASLRYATGGKMSSSVTAEDMFGVLSWLSWT